ncbi:MAG: DUF3995 domain-containing protein [Acidimicrobiia bacterium]
MDAAVLNIVPDYAIRRRRILAGCAVTLSAVAAMMAGAGPAFADEFTVGVVVDDVTRDSSATTFMEGFQLAVDQSPDVSHPPNTEGGDHLGGMDVAMVVVYAASEPDGILSATLDLVTTSRAPILVVDVPPDVLLSLIGPVTDAGTMLIAMSDTAVDVSIQTPLFLFAEEQDGLAHLLTDRVPVFEDAFIAVYGAPPSASATRGYIAGRLVDISVEATDRDPSDSETLLVAMRGALDASAAAPDVVVEDQAQVEIPESPRDNGSSVFAFVAVIGMMIAAALHLYWAAGGTWPGADRSDLARKVVGSTDKFPSTAMTLGVAALLVAGGVVVGGATGVWTLPTSDTLVRAASWVVGLVLVVRGLAGLILSGRHQVGGRGTPFSIRDLVIYSPLTLLLGGFTVAALMVTV